MIHNVINAPITATQAWDAYARLARAMQAEPKLASDPDYRCALASAHARFQRIFVGDM